jgi:hypothetical protein
MFSMKSTLIAMSCFVVVGMVACTSTPMRRVGTTGTAGTQGTAGTGTSAGTAGTGTSAGTAGTQGTAGTGTSAGTAGDQGAAGMTAGTAGASGTTGTAGAAGGAAGDQGTAGAAGTTAGTAGTGGAAGTTAGTGGGAGTGVAMVCDNTAVKSAGGDETKCTAKTMWKATAMPTPPSKYLNIPDNQLQPQYAIDGMIATRYSSGATMADGFYFQVDLGAAKMISGIVVDAGADALDVANGYDVGVSMDGTAFTSVATCMYNAAAKETINFTATMARYVRYTNKGAPGPMNGATSWLSIHEFDILCN